MQWTVILLALLHTTSATSVEYAELVAEIKSIKSDNAELVAEIKSLKKDNIHIHQELESIKSQGKASAVSNFVGFSATLQTPGYIEVGEGETIVFDVVYTNVAPETGGYDHTTGIFTCPLTGFYYFSLTLNSGQEWMFASIVMDGTVYAAAMCDADNNDQGFNSVVLHCNQGITVYVVTSRGNRVLNDLPGNIFTGFLIEPIL